MTALMMGTARLWSIIAVLLAWAAVKAAGSTLTIDAAFLVLTAVAGAANIAESAHRYRRHHAPRRHRQRHS